MGVGGVYSLIAAEETKERREDDAGNRPLLEYRCIFLLRQPKRYAYSVNAKRKSKVD